MILSPHRKCQQQCARLGTLHCHPKPATLPSWPKILLLLSFLATSAVINKPSCYGCGAKLQTIDSKRPGYITQDKFNLKQKHKQLRNSVICERCKRLTNGEILPAVQEGRLQKNAGAGITTPQELREILMPIRERKVLIALLVDLTDVSGTMLPRVRDLVAGNPIILIGTKADLLPRGTQAEKVNGWLYDAAAKRIGGIIESYVVSARNGDGMRDAAKSLLTTRDGRDLFLVGAANVGKSRFLSALLEYCPLPAAGMRKPISSATPGTTLDLVKLDVFSGGSSLYDTPGIHVPHRLAAQLLPDELTTIMPRRRMRPYTPPQSVCGTSLFWGGLMRIDIVQAPSAMRLSFFGFGLRVHECETARADREYLERAGVEWVPPLGRESAADLGGGEAQLKHKITIDVELTPLSQSGDIAVSGLGWVSLGCLSTLQPPPLRALLEVWVPPSVEVHFRPSIPVSTL